jgi:hypothetical protein
MKTCVCVIFLSLFIDCIDILELFGSEKVSLNDVLTSTIQLAEEGYLVSEITAFY